jgi:hypothetical protein
VQAETRQRVVAMRSGHRTVEISAEAFEIARRTAALHNVDVGTLLESLVKRHAEYVAALEEVAPSLPRFSLDRYELQRDSGESEEEFRQRLALFR